MTWASGATYNGDWVNGLMHGIGVEFRSNGSLRHKGEFLNGRASGGKQRQDQASRTFQQQKAH
jgi:antitoxin component YwqK of YwqJK toxin-antitoxin module